MFAQPVIANGTLCLGFDDGKVYAVNIADGTTRWYYQCGGPINHTAAMDSANVYVGANDGKLYAVRLADGTLAWTYDTGKAIQTALSGHGQRANLHRQHRREPVRHLHGRGEAVVLQTPAGRS